jgi:hypothetical protein
MGYWSTHPMGGDSPLDKQAEFWNIIDFDVYDVEDEGMSNEDIQKEIQKRVDKKLPELIEHFEECELGFVLPFTLVEWGVKIADKELSDQVKGLICDGGGGERGYDEDEEDSPQAYAKQLEQNWDKIMQGEIDVQDFLDKGLMYQLISKIFDTNDKGLINKN